MKRAAFTATAAPPEGREPRQGDRRQKCPCAAAPAPPESELAVHGRPTAGRGGWGARRRRQTAGASGKKRNSVGSASLVPRMPGAGGRQRRAGGLAVLV